jgi:glucose-6-phosphate isomerase
MNFDPDLNVRPTLSPVGFTYGPDCFGPPVERRTLDAIRRSLRDPNCAGPDVVYAIAMDVGQTRHRGILQDRMLLFGVVTYAAGRLGSEPVRSQGHVHKISTHSGWSPPEIYEIWSGRAVILMQEAAGDDPGRCFAVEALPGDVVVVPPNWAHATISADSRVPLTFGAWCDREYGFEYAQVRAHGGLAYFPILNDENVLTWERNSAYMPRPLVCKKPSPYECLKLERGIPIYRQFSADPARMQFVSQPALAAACWENFVP